MHRGDSGTTFECWLLPRFGGVFILGYQPLSVGRDSLEVSLSYTSSYPFFAALLARHLMCQYLALINAE